MSQKKSKMPKRHIPVAPPGYYRHPSKKDYKRKKKVEVQEPDDNYDPAYYDDHAVYDWSVHEDLMFLLNRLGINGTHSYRVTNYK